MNLGEVKIILEKYKDENPTLKLGFDDFHCWRGDYYSVAFRPAKNVNIQSMLEVVNRALIEKGYGYKGGEYTFNESTTVYFTPDYSYYTDAAGDGLSLREFERMLKDTVKENDTLLEEALALWQDAQIWMSMEENNELIIELAKMNKLICKLKRFDNLTVESLIINPSFHARIEKLCEEIADVKVVLLQFFRGLEEQIASWKEYKLTRLHNLVEEEKKRRKKE